MTSTAHSPSATTTPHTSSTSSAFDADLVARITLACAGVSGDPTITDAIETFGGAAPLVAAVHHGRYGDAAPSPVPLSPLTLQRVRALATGSRVTAVVETIAQHGIAVLSPLHAGWPTRLASLRTAAPLVLFTRGNVAALQRPSIALTGTTIPTAYQIYMALELGTGLADRGWTVASGATAAIDRLVVTAAQAMTGTTITVTTASLDGDFPEPPFDTVMVSEVPPTAMVGVRSQRRARRLLAAITSKTILIHADLTDDALRSAVAAQLMGRPVGVVVGPDGSPTSTGDCDRAGRYGLTPVASIGDADRLR